LQLTGKSEIFFRRGSISGQQEIQVQKPKALLRDPASGSFSEVIGAALANGSAFACMSADKKVRGVFLN